MTTERNDLMTDAPGNELKIYLTVLLRVTESTSRDMTTTETKELTKDVPENESPLHLRTPLFFSEG